MPTNTTCSSAPSLNSSTRTQGPLGKIDGTLRLGRQALLDGRLAIRRRQAAEIDKVQRLRCVRGNHLHGAVVNLRKGSPQYFVPPHDLVEGPFQGRHVQRAAHAGGRKHGVCRRAFFNLVDDPQGLLAVRHRQRRIPADRGNRRQFAQAPRRLQRADPLGQLRQRRRGEQRYQRQFDREGVPHAGGNLHGQQGMSAQVEEVVMYADALDAQHLHPNRRQAIFQRRARGNVAVLQRRGRFDARQQPSIHLAVGKLRQCVEEHKSLRDQALGQGGAEELPHFARPFGACFVILGPAIAPNNIGGQELAAIGGSLRHNRRLRNRRMAAEHRFDFSEFDADAGNLHLVVEPAQESDVSIGQIATAVARPVEPAAGSCR